MNAKHDEILTLNELAAYLKISKATLYKLAGENNLPGQRSASAGGFTRTPSTSG